MNLMLQHLQQDAQYHLYLICIRIVAAIGSLKGPLHGGANEQVMKMLSEVKSLDEVDNYLDKKLANKEKSWDSVIVYIKRRSTCQVLKRNESKNNF